MILCQFMNNVPVFSYHAKSCYHLHEGFIASGVRSEIALLCVVVIAIAIHVKYRDKLYDLAVRFI